MIVPSIRQLATAIGLSHVVMTKHFHKGKFQRESSGGFDVAKVRAALMANSDPSQPSRIAKKPAASTQPTSLGSPEAFGSGVSPYDAFNRARAAKEIAIAQEKQLDLRERKGELLERSEVEAAWTEGQTAFKNALLLFPDKAAPKLVGCSTVIEYRAVLAEEVRRLLNAFSEGKVNAA